MIIHDVAARSSHVFIHDEDIKEDIKKTLNQSDPWPLLVFIHDVNDIAARLSLLLIPDVDDIAALLPVPVPPQVPSLLLVFSRRLLQTPRFAVLE